MHIDYQKVIKTINFFNSFKHDEIERVVSILKIIHVEEGKTLFQHGHQAVNCYIVLSGNYMIYYKEGQAFTLHKPGEIIGYTSLVAPFYYTSTCVSLTEGELILLSRANFYRLVQVNSMLSNKIIEEINKVAEKRQFFTQHMND